SVRFESVVEPLLPHFDEIRSERPFLPFNPLSEYIYNASKNLVNVIRVLHALLMEKVFVFIVQMLLGVGIHFYIQIVIDVIQCFLIIDKWRGKIAIVVYAIVTQHADYIEPVIHMEVDNRRFTGDPCAPAAFSDQSTVVASDYNMIRPFQDCRLGPYTVDVPIMLITLDLDLAAFPGYGF